MRKNVFFDYVGSNKKNFLLILGVFLIGIILGIIFINHISNNEINQITAYINLIKENIKSNESIDKFSFFRNCVKQNLKLVFIIWILGTTIIGEFFIYVIIAYKGFSIGYTISSIIASLGIKSGSVFVFSFLLPKNIIMLPIIFVLAESGLKFYIRAIKKNMDIKNEIIRHTIIMLIAIIVVFLSSFIEAYLCTKILLVFKNFI